MDYKRFLRALLVWAMPSCLLFGFSGVIAAAPLTWYVVAHLPPTPTEQTFFEGSFTYDADTGVASQWNIQSSSPLGVFYPPSGPVFYGPHDPLCYVAQYPDMCRFDSISPANTDITFTYDDTFVGFFWQLELVFSAPLSDSGGTISLVPGRATGGICPPGSCGSIFVRQDEVYSIVDGSVSTVPEPGTGLPLVLLIAPIMIACSRVAVRPLSGR